MNKLSTLLFFAFFYSCGHSQNPTTTSSKSEKVQPQEDSIFREKFKIVFGKYLFVNKKESKQESDSKILYRSNYKVTFSAVTDVDKILGSQCFLTIENVSQKYTDTLDFKSPVFVTSLNADIDIYNDTAFICWVSGNPEKQIPSTIWLKIINLKSNKIELFKKIYTQLWGVERIAIVFNPFNNVIHIAYNDFSQPDSKYLYFGSVNALNITKSSPQLFPISILNQDNTEKRYPKFLRTRNSIFLYNTSGDTWGFFAHTGKQGIGISRIDKFNNPTEYKILADSSTINEDILLQNDTIFYQHVIGKNHQDFEIKKIKIADLSIKK